MGILWIWILERSREWSNRWACCTQKRALGNLRFPVRQKQRNPERWKKENCHIISTMLWSRILHGQSLFDCENDLRSNTYGRNERPRHERGYMGESWWIRLFKQQFILVKTLIRIYDSWRIISGVLWRNYSKKLKKWSRTRHHWLIKKVTHGARQACCVTEFIRSRTPRPTSSQTQCFVSQRSLERGKLSGLFEINHLKDLNRIDGEPMEFDNILRIHNIWLPRTDSRIFERTTVCSRAVQREDNLHVNVQRHCMVRKRKCRER